MYQTDLPAILNEKNPAVKRLPGKNIIKSLNYLTVVLAAVALVLLVSLVSVTTFNRSAIAPM